MENYEIDSILYFNICISKKYVLEYIYFYILTHTNMKQHIEAFHAKHNVRPYTVLLLTLLATTVNSVSAAGLINF